MSRRGKPMYDRNRDGMIQVHGDATYQEFWGSSVAVMERKAAKHFNITVAELRKRGYTIYVEPG